MNRHRRGESRALSLVAGTVMAVALTCFASSLVRAQPSESDDERARTHFESGRLYFEEGAYDRALAEFESAYRLSQRATLLVNMANANERLGRPDLAARNLRDYLAIEPEAEDRIRIERRIENLDRLHRERQATTTVSGTPPPADTAATEPPPTETSPPVEEPARPRRKLAVPLVAFGAGAAGLLVMAITGPMALHEDQALADGCGATRSCSASDVAPANRLALTSDIGLGVGIAGAAVGTLLLFVGPGRAPASSEATGVRSLRVAPAVARGAFGITSEFRF